MGFFDWYESGIGRRGVGSWEREDGSGEKEVGSWEWEAGRGKWGEGSKW